MCDGFVGNVVLKFYESVGAADRAAGQARRARDPASATTCARCSAILDYSEYGGAPLLGVQGRLHHLPRLVAARNAIKNAIRVAVQSVEAGLSQHIGAEFAGARRAQRMSRAPIAAFAGLGVAVPDRVVTNADLSKTLDTSDQWIVERTGIRERRIARAERDARRCWPRGQRAWRWRAPA